MHLKKSVSLASINSRVSLDFKNKFSIQLDGLHQAVLIESGNLKVGDYDAK